MALTNTSAKNVKDKAYKLYDSEGLFLFVPTSGKKVWRFKYRFNKKEKLLVISTPRHLTLGKVLKSTGITKIPV